MVLGMADILNTLFKVDQGIVTDMASLIKPPFPFLCCIEGFASDLPIQKIGFLFFVAIKLQTNVFFTDALNLAQGWIDDTSNA
jgi:hypothetical protein